MAAVRRWTRNLEQREFSGRVRAVPILNVTAFRARSPFVVPEDGKNLNRCFPGNPDGTLAERLAYAAFTELITGSDAVIDAHCGDMVEALEPFALYEAGAAEATARDMALAYGLGYVIRQERGPGPRGGRHLQRRGGGGGHPGHHGRGGRLRAGRGLGGGHPRAGPERGADPAGHDHRR